MNSTSLLILASILSLTLERVVPAFVLTDTSRALIHESIDKEFKRKSKPRSLTR